MRIAQVSFGHIDVILPLFKHLQYSDLDVDLYLCFSLNRKSESILDFTDKTVSIGFSDYKKTRELLGEEINKYVGDISKVKFFIFHNLKLRSVRNVFLTFRLSRKLRNYDIIHFNGTNGVLPLLILLLRKKRLVFTIHDIRSHSGERTRFNFAEKFNDYLVKSSYPIIIHNRQDYNFLANNFSGKAGKFNFIPFGVLDVYHGFKNKSVIAPSSDLLFFGRISPYKGIEYLVSAIELLKKRGLSVRTIIAGHGSVYFNTEKFAELNIILINNYITNEYLVSLIENTKIIVCPYTDATQSGVVMTAFAFNKAVIASDVGSFSELINDGLNGFLVPPKDINALALKIEKAVTDPILLEQMQFFIQSLATSGDYSWPHITMKLRELYFSFFSDQ